ncbi:MAG: methylated-DNA--[protein]-cysteine S-methyltransferase [Candidatus Aureabacteria bacterium]|nr:methylated-DNA--[protein]-cysteine S-methyltransferase [Candidatus Auribacterota bacterium]
MIKEKSILIKKGLKIEIFSENGILKRISISRSLKKNGPIKEVREHKLLMRMVLKYLSKGKDEFLKVSLDLGGYTKKEQKVLKEMRKIPFGKTVSYKELAKMSGNVNSARFVGNVCKKNSFPLLIPCHRVIKNDGSLGGYTGGLNIKKELLKLETSYIAESKECI